MPYKICGQSRTKTRSSIAENVDGCIEVFDLESIVKRIPESMCPVEKRKRAESD